MPKNSDDLTPVSGTASTVEGEPTNQTDALTEKEFISLLSQGESRDWNGCRVMGNVNLAGMEIASPLVIRGAVFMGEANFNQCRFKRGVDFTGCHFEQKLILSDARVEGPLILDNVVIGAKTEPRPDLEMIRRIIAHLEKGRQRAQSDGSEPREFRRRVSQQCWEDRLKNLEAQHPVPQTIAEFINLHVAGRLSMMNASVFGGLSCTHADIEDDFRIDEAQIYGDLKLRRSCLGEFCTDAKMRIASADAVDEKQEDRPCRIDGSLDLTSTKVAGDVRLVGVTIGGELILQAADINGNLLCRASKHVRTRIRNGAWLFEVRVRGAVDLSGTRLCGGLNLGNAEIGGHINCARSGKWWFTMDGDADVPNSSVGAYFSCWRSRIRGNVNLGGAQIKGDVSFTGANLKKGLFLQNASVGGTLFCTATTDLEKNLPCKIAKDVWLLGAVITGGIDISGAHIGGNLVAQNAGVGQNLQAKIMGGFQTQIKGNVFLNGVRISGAAEFLGSILQGELDLDSASISGNLMVAFDLNEEDDWKIVRSHVGGRIHAESATIGKRVILMGLTIRSTGPEDAASAEGERKDFAPAGEKHGVDFVGAQINGEFLLYSKDLVEEHLQSKKAGFQAREISPKKEQELFVQARRERAEIQGSLRLTRAQLLGGIVLDGSIIEGELDLQDANVRANIICRQVELAPSGEPIRAFVRRAYLENLDAVGNVDLTGLRIGGDLTLRDARIRGRLELCHSGRGRKLTDSRRRAVKPKGEQKENGKQKSEDQVAEIGGVLRLDAAEIRHVILSGDSFGERETPAPSRSSWERIKGNIIARIRTARGHIRAAWGRGDYLVIMFLLRGGHLEEATSFRKHPEEEEKDTVVLKRATIGRLEIIKPLPGILDLSELKVGSWEERASFFKDMLQHSYPFRKSSYVAIENDLRNKGRSEEADEVHVWMRRRDRIYTRSFFKVLWDRFLDLITKYGTTSARLFWVMLILFALSVWVFSNPNHVEYKIAPLAGQPPPVEHPAATDWRIADAVFLAMQLHVPIVSLGIDEEAQPSGTKIKAYAMAVTAASWVMWPLFIASISGFLRKRV